MIPDAFLRLFASLLTTIIGYLPADPFLNLFVGFDAAWAAILPTIDQAAYVFNVPLIMALFGAYLTLTLARVAWQAYCLIYEYLPFKFT